MNLLFHFPHSFPLSESGPMPPDKTTLKPLYRSQIKLLSFLSLRETLGGPSLHNYLFSMEEDDNNAC